jgi:hypothetical protein
MDMQFTRYFETTRLRPDRASILPEWIERTILYPEHRFVQSDGRIRLWLRIPEADNRWLRVVLLDDQRTIHNAFFDRSFTL